MGFDMGFDIDFNIDFDMGFDIDMGFDMSFDKKNTEIILSLITAIALINDKYRHAFTICVRNRKSLEKASGFVRIAIGIQKALFLPLWL